MRPSFSSTTRPRGRGSAAPSPSGNLKPAWKEMLKHVYHPARLKILDPLKTVTGTVVNIKAMPNGDVDVILNTGMECNIICAHRVTQADAVSACQNYINKVTIPKVGKNVQVTGQHVLNIFHKQQEIHPVFELKIL